MTWAFPFWINLLLISDSVAVAPPDSGWSFTDRADGANGKPVSEERSQAFLAEIAVCAGFSDPNYYDGERVVTIDAPIKSKPLIYVIAKQDTLRPKPTSACPNETPSPDYREYLVVVRQGGGGVPDSLRVVLADESSFWIRYEYERKTR